jgi:hypothetical protein
MKRIQEVPEYKKYNIFGEVPIGPILWSSRKMLYFLYSIPFLYSDEKNERERNR